MEGTDGNKTVESTVTEATTESKARIRQAIGRINWRYFGVRIGIGALQAAALIATATVGCMLANDWRIKIR